MQANFSYRALRNVVGVAAIAISTCGHAATTVYNETWNSVATTGVNIATGSLTADNTYTVVRGTNAGQAQITDLGGGDKTLDHLTAGTGTGSDYTFTAPIGAGGQVSITSGGILFQFEVNQPLASLLTGNRHGGIAIRSNTGSLDGYAVRFANRADGCRLEVGTINNGAAPAYTQLNPASPLVPASPGKVLRIRVLVRPGATTTAVSYSVFNVTDNVDFFTPGTLATPLAFVPDAGTVVNEATITVRQGTMARFDNFNITRDATAPVITLLGTTPVNQLRLLSYTDAGATATDDTDGTITGNIVTVNTVNTATAGAYTVTYNVSDSYGNAATQALRNVNIIDAPPVITLLGTTPVNITCGSSYVDAGATANDDVSGDITANISTVSTVNTTAIGSYTVSYNVSDGAGNPATTVVRTVNVNGPCPDVTPPVITLLGSTPVNITCGSVYNDAGATASDDVNGNITANINTVSTVNTSSIGSYTATYTVSDGAGNPATPVVRTVNVNGPCPDLTPPVITLLGASPVNVTCGGVYNDAGATASDNIDGNITANINTVNTVNTSNIGSYTVTYTVSDAAGNPATPVVRAVNVNGPCPDVTPPVITLLGATPVNITCGANYVDAGATASDNVDGNITANINTVNTVNTSNIGSYTVTYTVSDGAGNPATPVVRTVNVNGPCPDVTPPVITLLGSTPVNITCGSVYNDAGATASDDVNGNITANINTINTVNTSNVGSYTVTYAVSDAAGNAATNVVRTVNVSGPCPDLTPPVITRIGSASITINCGDTYTDAGATASDNVDGNITVNIVTVNPVNPNVPANYLVTYNVSDLAGNQANQVSRFVTVSNNCAGAPLVITEVGPSTIEITEGATATFEVSATGSGALSYQWFKDEGSKADLPVGGNQDSLIFVDASLADAGDYYVEVSDDDETANSAIFTLNVLPQVPLLSGLGLAAVAALCAGAGARGLVRNRK